MGIFSNKFPVAGRTVVITGGSQGMGLEAGKQLSAKGANIVIVARTQLKLEKGLEDIKTAASSPETQRFHYISADLTSATECVRVIEEAESWNGSPPDIVWCCAGSALPTLFIDTPVASFEEHMKNNYSSSLYMAHAIMNRWLRPANNESSLQKQHRPADRHLIFTSSIAALFPIIGYSPYAPSKAALRALSEALSQEMNLYEAAHPSEPRVRLHTIFPGTILTEGYQSELRTKPDVQKSVEELDAKQTPDVIASKSIAGLESGLEHITTDFIGGLARQGSLGHATRGGFFRAIIDALMTGIVALVILVVRGDMDKQVQTWGRKYGTSGKKGPEKDAQA